MSVKSLKIFGLLCLKYLSVVSAVSCNHGFPTSYISLRNFAQLTSCFKEVAKYGSIRTNPDLGKRTDQIILDHGYYLTTYKNVTSKDGYIQTMFRITGNSKSPPYRGKPAVLLFHSAFSSSSHWFLLGEKSLPFVLADAEFDVWIMNARGTSYSQRHVKLNSNLDLDYWNFSYYEMAVYDLPLYIELMLFETVTEKIFYIGYSLGGTVYAAALSENPGLNNKIRAAFLYGAGVFVGHTKTMARLSTAILNLPKVLQQQVNMLFGGQIPPRGNIQSYQLQSRVCSSSAIACGLCGNVVFSFMGYDTEQLNYTRVPDIISLYPDITSFKLSLHLAQNYKTCRFLKYDYGREANLMIYGRATPPAFNLSNLRAPLYLYYGESDDFITLADLTQFKNSLPNGTVKAFRSVNWKTFNHFSFFLAKDAYKLVYNKIINDMRTFL